MVLTRLLQILSVLLIALSFGTLHAQETPSEAPSLVVSGEGRSAEVSYHRAFQLLAAGDEDAAQRELEFLVRAYPTHPLATRADTILSIFAETTSLSGSTSKPKPKGEQPNGLARGELVVTQTLHGIALGVELCFVIDCDDSRLAVGTVLATAAAGLTFSLLLNRDTGMYPGHTAALNSGTYWGAWHGLAGSMILELDEDATAGMMAVSQIAGLGAGHLIYSLVGPTAGDVSMTTSAGVWMGAWALMVNGLLEFNGSTPAIFSSLLIASDVGLVIGALLTERYPMTRGRSLIIDASGIAGTLLGVGLPVLIMGDDVDAQFVFGSALVGSMLGLGLGVGLTHGTWDDPEDLVDLNIGLMPVALQPQTPFGEALDQNARGGLFVVGGAF